MNRKLVYLINIVDRYSMLEKERLDGAFDDELSARYTLSSRLIDSSEFSVRFTLTGNAVYFGVSKQSVPIELRKKLNMVWLDMLEQNLLDPIYKKYGLSIDMHQLLQFPVVLLSDKN